jgi:hypothetical protein
MAKVCLRQLKVNTFVIPARETQFGKISVPILVAQSFKKQYPSALCVRQGMEYA